MAQLDFKFKYVGEDGQPEGFLSKKASFDGELLTLDGSAVPIILILKVERRAEKLILHIIQEDGLACVVIAITGGNIKELSKELNLHSSRNRAQIRSDALANRGLADMFRMENCPSCTSAIDLSGGKDTPQVYCPYCEALFMKSDRKKKSIALTLCDECGYYSNPQLFTTFYFYFLLVIYGYRYQKRHMCHSCMRGEAWKMLAANFLFVLGVPVAIGQLTRAYMGGTGSSLPGLDSANTLAKKGNYPKAKTIYEKLKDEPNHAAGIFYNMAHAALDGGQDDAAKEHLWQALETCGNYTPAYSLLSALYKHGGNKGEMSRLEEFWDCIPEEEPESPSEDSIPELSAESV